MDYGKLLSRTWNLIWEHKFLILLGILVALGGSGSSGSASSGGRSLFQFDQEGSLPQPPEWRGGPFPPMREFDVPVVPALAIFALVGIALIIGLAVWVVSTLARGALISGASAADAGDVTSFGAAFAAAWQKVWKLLGIGIFPAIPALFLLLASLGAVGAYLGTARIINTLERGAGPRVLWIVFATVGCVSLPLMFVLNLLRTFANRACMLEGGGVFAAYKRGFRVLADNLGSALLLFLIQVGINIALGLVLLLPALCCVLWPLLLVVQGTLAAYFSTMWTLAWRQWVGVAPVAD